MNRPNCTTLLALMLLALISPVWAQTIGGTDAETAPPGSTVITSDELRSDQTTHTSVFTGNVQVTGTNFNLACEEMTVTFVDGKVDHIVATGNVVITQPDRLTHSGQAEYFRSDDKFVLTDSPVITNADKSQLSAPIITMFRVTHKLITSGGKSKVILAPGTTTPPTTTAPTDTP